MRVALDEGVPEAIGDRLPGHDVQSVGQLGLKGLKNGRLLAAITDRAFEAFITNDKRMEAEGLLAHRPFAILILSAINWLVIEPHVGKIADALERQNQATLYASMSVASCHESFGDRHLEAGPFDGPILRSY